MSEKKWSNPDHPPLGVVIGDLSGLVAFESSLCTEWSLMNKIINKVAITIIELFMQWVKRKRPQKV